MTLNNIRMSAKLPVAFVALSLAVALAISTMAYRDFRTSLVTQTGEMLDVLTTERANALEKWFEGINTQVLNFANDPTIVSAMMGFNSTFGLLMDDPVADLQKAYIDDNPHPIGSKDLLNRAEASIPYHFQHDQFHPVFRSIKDRLGLYDFFLLDVSGNMVYSVFKERDFATNFETGPYRDSGLAQVFREARSSTAGTSYFSDFSAYAPSNGAPAAFISSPITDAQNEVIGVLAIQLPTDTMNSIIVNEQGLGATGELTAIGPDRFARTQSRFDNRHSTLSEVTPNNTVWMAFENETARYVGEPDLAGNAAVGVSRLMDIMGQQWLIVGEFDLTEVYEAAIAKRNKTLAFTAISMLAVALCGWFMSRAFSRPLDQLVTAMARVSERDYDAELPDLKRNDEIGDLSRAVTLVVDRLREFDDKLEAEKTHAEAQKFAVGELASGLKRLADGDFSTSLDRNFAQEYDELRVNYNETVQRLGDTIAGLKKFSEMLQNQTETIGRDSSELSQRTENQASTLEETAAAIDQVTETITQSGDDLRSAETLILETDGHVKQGRMVVKNTTKAMDEIEKSSEEISSIIRVVDDIAFQTNLLALNAGVEAARAGDAGRGFAVVAAEVRQLAMRSAEAVAQIKSLIETSSANVGSGVTLVRETESVLLEIVQRMEGISTVITSVASGVTEQAGSISEINTGVNNLDRVTQQNAAMVENSNASVQALSSEAINLGRMLAAFKVSGALGGVTGVVNPTFTSKRSA